MDSVEHRQDHSDHPKIDALNIPELYQCVHCGLCLNQCPTYRALPLEAESPRGRIHLVRAAAEGRVALNDRFSKHLYLCLMCRACESACPSGVRYGRIAEAAREQLGPPGSVVQRAFQKFVFHHLLPYLRRLTGVALLLRLYQRVGLQPLICRVLPRRLREMEAMLSGCIMSVLFSGVSEATVRVLRRNGCEVLIPKRQTCCGALNVHNGETRTARKMARKTSTLFWRRKWTRLSSMPRAAARQ